MTRTKEGLAISLHVSFQYQIMKDKLADLYNLTNVNYFRTYVTISRDTILKIAGNYNANSYWEKRHEIGEEIMLELDKSLNQAFAKVESVQVLKIELPTSYEDSIVMTQVEVQNTNMKKFEQEAELIRQGISVIESEAQKKIQIVNAEASAQATILTKAAEAQASNNLITAESSVYKNMETKLALTSADLVDLVSLNAINSKKDSNLLIGMQNSIINFGNRPVAGN